MRWLVGSAGQPAPAASAALLQRRPLVQYSQYSLEILLKIRSSPLMSGLGNDYRFARRERAISTVVGTESVL